MNIDLRDAAQGVLPYAEQVAPEGGGGQVVASFISTLLSAALVIAAILVLLYLIWGAIEWISAGGDSGKIEQARTRIMQSIVGLIVLAAVIAIFALVQTLLGVTLIRLSGGGAANSTNGYSDSGSVNTACPCGGGAGYASTGALGSLGGVCYRCTNSGWQETDLTECPVINCSWP